MFCKKCGNEMHEGAKFCNGCGNPNELAGGSNTSNNMNETTNTVESFMNTNSNNDKGSVLDSVNANKTGTFVKNLKKPELKNIKIDTSKMSNLLPYKFLSKKALVTIGALAAVAVVAGVTVWNSNTVVLGRAIMKTSDSMYDELMDNAQMLPVVNHLDDMSKSTYHVNYSMEEGSDNLDLDMKLNFKKSEYEVTASMYNNELFTAKLSEKYLTVEGPAFTDVVGLDLQQMKKDYSVPTFNVVEIIDDIYDAAYDISKSQITELVKSMDLEKGSGKARIDNKSVSTKVYSTTITPSMMEELYENIYDEISNDKNISKYISSMEEAIEDLIGESVDTDALLDYILDEMLYSLGYMQDIELSFHIYKGYIVAIEVFDGYSDYELAISSVKNLLENITLSYEGEDVMTISNIVNKNKYTLSCESMGYEVISFVYNGDRTKNNASLSVDNDSISFTMTEPKKNELSIAFVYEDRWSEIDINIDSAKGSISKYSFNIDKNFVNILELIEDYGYNFMDEIIDYRSFY